MGLLDSNIIRVISAGAYYLVQKLNKALNIPIVKILLVWCGTTIESLITIDIIYTNAIYVACSEIKSRFHALCNMD